jgi:O6-methylguanine-DNA--protein-cysteine methyltransferase
MLAAQIRRLRSRLGASFAPGEDAALAKLARELGEYFAGSRRHFELSLELAGSDFQRRVWSALLEIPFGETRSYADVARALVAILVPCHRVVGSDGRLTGYGGGLWRKQRLLDHERASAA